MSTLGNKVFIAAIWSVGLRMFIKSLALVNTVILARLLAPEDFGLIAIVMSVFAFIDVLQSFGLEVVLIQKQKANDSVYNTAWTIKVVFGVLTGILMFIVAPFIADFYGDERLTAIARVTALFFIIQGVTNIGVVNFRKDLDFKKEFAFRSTVKVFAVAITISLALYLRSYWALLIAMLFTRVFEVIFSFYMSKYRPKLTLRDWREIIGFSSWLFLNSFVQFFNRNITTLSIGKIFGVSSTGVYSFSDEFANLPNNELVAAVNRATFPGYSKISDQRTALKVLYLQVLSAIVAIGIPASAAVAMLAHIFVPVLLGDKWLAAIPLIQVLGIAYAVICINTNVGYIFHAIGKPHVPTLSNTARIVILVILLFTLMPRFGLIGAAWAMFCLAFIMFPIYYLLLRRAIPLGFFEYIRTLIRPIAGTLSMFFVIHRGVPMLEQMRGQAFDINLLLLVCVAFIAGIAYLLTVLILWLMAGKPEGPEAYAVNFILEKLKLKPGRN